jgi:hypothetical protein
MTDRKPDYLVMCDTAIAVRDRLMQAVAVNRHLRKTLPSRECFIRITEAEATVLICATIELASKKALEAEGKK